MRYNSYAFCGKVYVAANFCLSELLLKVVIALFHPCGVSPLRLRTRFRLNLYIPKLQTVSQLGYLKTSLEVLTL